MDDSANGRILKDAIENDGGVRAVFARLSGLIGLQLLNRDAGKAAEAVDLITRAIQLEPCDAELYHERGLAYIAADDYELAVRDLSRAIELEPGYLPYYGIRGSLHMRREDYDEAIEDLGRVLRESGRAGCPFEMAIDKEKHALYLSIAYLLRSMRGVNGGDLEAARSDFEKAEDIVGRLDRVSGRFGELHALFLDLKALCPAPLRLT